MKNRKMFWVISVAALLSAACAQAQQPAARQEQAPPPVKALAMMASTVPISDIDRSVAFYTKGLGMTQAGKNEMGNVTEIPLNFPGGGAYLLLLKSKVEGATVAPSDSNKRVILAVPDLKALEAQLIAAGYHLEGKINEMPRFKVSVGQLNDPDGNHIELVQRGP